MEGLLDDLSFADVQKMHDEDDIEVGSSSDWHLEECFYEKAKGKNVLMFALVRFGKYERYDIRTWFDNASKPGKGLSMTEVEIIELKTALLDSQIDVEGAVERARYQGGKVSAIIYDRICLLSEYNVKNVGWNKEITIVDWGYGKKIDFRKW